MTSLFNARLTAACDANPAIVTPKSRLQEATGFTEAYLLSLGLTKGDLLRLERAGMLIRGYTQDKDGRKKMFVLIGDDTNA